MPSEIRNPGAPGQNRRRRLSGLGVAVALLAMLGLYVGFPLPGAETQPALPTSTVVIDTIEQTVSALGAIKPKNYVDVGAQVSGQLKTIDVEIGARVARGQLLAEIDASVLKANVAADEARLRNVEAQIEEQRANVELATVRLERAERLHRSKTASLEEFDTARAEMRAARAKLDALRARADEVQATLDGNKASLGYTRIYAPLAGTVVSINAVEGQTLNASQQTPTILRIANLDVMTVWAQVAEADIGKIRPGMPAYFRTLGNDRKEWRAAVGQVLPTPETINDVILYNVLIDVANEARELMIDMTAQVFFVIAEASDVPVVPVAALQASGSEPHLWHARAVTPSGIEERTVRTGVVTRTEAEVVSGLAAGDDVVTGSIPLSQALPSATGGAAHTRGTSPEADGAGPSAARRSRE